MQPGREPMAINEDQPASLLANGCQGRKQEAELANAGIRGDQLGQGAARPASAGKTPVKTCITVAMTACEWLARRPFHR